MMLPPDPEYVFIGDMDSILCITYSLINNEERILAGTHCGKVHIWDLQVKREISSFKSGEHACISINIAHEEDDTVITQNKNGEINFWKENNNEWSKISSIMTDFFGFSKSVLFEGVLYTSVKNGGCQMISVKTKQTINKVKLSDGINLGDVMAFKVLLLNKEKHIFVAYEGQQLILWAFDELKKISSLKTTACPMAIDFDVATNKGICGNPSDKIEIFSLTKNLELKVHRTISLVNAGVASVQIRPDSRLVSVGCWDGKIKLYSWKTLTLLAVLDVHFSTVQDICFYENSQKTEKIKYLMVAGSKDKRISLWDIYN